MRLTPLWAIALVFSPVFTVFPAVWTFVWWEGRRHLDETKIRLPDVDLP